jgi:hypothetical protein
MSSQKGCLQAIFDPKEESVENVCGESNNEVK